MTEVPRYGWKLADSLIAKQLMEERDQARAESDRRGQAWIKALYAFDDALHMIDELVYQLEEKK